MCFACYVTLSQYATKDNSQTPFYEILSRYAKNAVSRIKDKKTKGLESLEKNQSELEYYINSEKLSPESTIIVNKIIKSFQEKTTHVNNLSNKETNRIQKFIDFEYYAHLSLLLATYGLLLLFISPLESRLHYDLRGFLLCSNVLTLFSVIHSTVWELPFKINEIKYNFLNKLCGKINIATDFLKQILAPRFVYIIISFVLYTFLFFYGIWNRDYFVTTLSEKYPFLYRNSIVFSVILCFSNFIIYFAITSIRHEITVSRFIKSLNKEKLEDLVRNYTALEKDAKREMEANPLQKVSEISITEKKQNGSPENNDKE